MGKYLEKILLRYSILKVIHLLLAKLLPFLPFLFQYLKTTAESSPNLILQQRRLLMSGQWQLHNLQHYLCLRYLKKERPRNPWPFLTLTA